MVSRLVSTKVKTMKIKYRKGKLRRNFKDKETILVLKEEHKKDEKGNDSIIICTNKL